MALTPTALREVGTGFFETLQLGAEARRLADDQLHQLAELLPEPDTWATLGRGDHATLVLLRGEVLLTVSQEMSTEEEPQLLVTAHRLRITEVTYRRKNQHTVWDFQFRDREPLRVEGRMNDPSAPGAAETFDQAEAFARTLAASIGWRIVEQALVHDQEPGDDELARAASSARDDASGQRVTDLWGNPLSKPTRGKR
jgi:hypothetical protein